MPSLRKRRSYGDHDSTQIVTWLGTHQLQARPRGGSSTRVKSAAIFARGGGAPVAAQAAGALVVG